MKTLLRSTFSPIVSIALLMFGSGFFISFLSLYLKGKGYNETFIGYVQAAYFAGLVLGALRIERVIRRIGHIRAFATFGSLCAITILLLSVFDTPAVWLIARFINGLSTAGLWIVVESWLMELSTEKTRGQVLSIYMIALYFALAMGQFLFPILQLDTIEPFVIPGVIVIFSIIPVSMTRYPSPELSEPTLPNLITIFRVSPFGVSGCFLAGTIMSVIYSFQPIFAVQKGIPVSVMMSTTIFGGMILQYPIGKLSDLIDRKKVLLFCALGVIPAALFMVLFSSLTYATFVAAFILGGIAFTIYPLSITQVCDHFEVNNITAVTGVLLLAYGSGSTVGPLLAPYFELLFGGGFLYAFIILMAFLLALIGGYSLLFRTHIPVAEQQDYVALPSITTAAFELDPRATDETTFEMED